MADYTLMEPISVHLNRSSAEKKFDALSFTTASLSDTLREVQQFTHNGGLILPLYALARSSPFEKEGTYTANSEEHSGSGEFRGKEDAYAVTLHGGRDGQLLLTPDVIDRAAALYNGHQNGITPIYAIDLERTIGKTVFNDLLDGGLPDGSLIPLFSLDELLAGKTEVLLSTFQRFGIVRTLAQARETTNCPLEMRNRPGMKDGYLRIKPKETLVRGVFDSQLLAYCGSRSEAKHLLQKLVPYEKAHVCVQHPFNKLFFEAERPQGRILTVSDLVGNATVSLLLLNGDAMMVGNMGRYIALSTKNMQQAVGGETQKEN